MARRIEESVGARIVERARDLERRDARRAKAAMLAQAIARDAAEMPAPHSDSARRDSRL